MKKIGIFCGGYSSEYDISVKSAQTILSHFPQGFEGIQILVSKSGWIVNHQGMQGVFDLNKAMIIMENGAEWSLDGAIIYIHGNPGENGKIQAYLDMVNIPYVNSSVLASSLSFDKWYCNQFLKSFQIPVAESKFLIRNENFNVDVIVSQLGLPIFVKPTDSGSSYGISKVKAKEALAHAIEKAFLEGDSIVLEAFLDGTEVTCGVYRNGKDIVALPLTEIVSENEFFDFEAKYQGKSAEITPARISLEQSKKIQDQAKIIYKLLNLKSIARIDFMLVKETPYVIEVNTTPGFSSESIVPKMLKEAGISISEFWDSILNTELQNR